MGTRARLVHLLLLFGALPAAAATTSFSPDDIKATFGTGTPFTATSLGGTVYSFNFSSDGTAVEVAEATKVTINGVWRVDATGYCSKWGKSAEHCYTVETNGDHYDVRDSAGHIVSRWALPADAARPRTVAPPIASAATAATTPPPGASIPKPDTLDFGAGGQVAADSPLGIALRAAASKAASRIGSPP